VELSEYKQLFLTEAQEIMSLLNKTLVELEKDPQDIELLNELFRLSHTLKSMAQTMGYGNIASLTHSVESALALLKSGQLKADVDTVVLLFKSLDYLDALIGNIIDEKDEEIDVSHLIEKLDLLAQTDTPGKRKSSKKKSSASKSQKEPLEEKQPKEIQADPSSKESQFVRIPLSKLDQLMDLTGELVINRTLMDRISAKIDDDILEETVTQLSRLTSRLQDQMMQMRLVPLEYVFTSYHRLVRDMAVAESKEIDLVIKGSSIGLDRSIQDEINEPLLHIIKNAVAHGIEDSGQRKKLGKKPRGTITLSAKREKNSVHVELSDDGRGIFVDEIKETALKSGIINEKDLDQLTPEEVMMLITYPGYSRAESVTETAGRGMGLDVSRIKVESLGGELRIDSVPNEGTKFTLKLPLTMAIIQSLLVGLGNETYCIPLPQVVETIKVSPNIIKTMEHREIISHRDSVLPLIRIRETFGFPSKNGDLKNSSMGSMNSKVSIVVVEMGSRKVGLIVDQFLGQQDAVIKSLTGIMTHMKYVSGATILGTGKVAMIIDVPSLF